ncbi:hypothetical protein HHK36_019603 [Tetracentron sinense]|uniref:Uncharacterized protein n=1 Tax=Tetracentron sinense TaxID=13715 RepID=A0A835D9R6_TETSI|nr:hypothetical protein HHK36_019603 [Tetracentron sinense]
MMQKCILNGNKFHQAKVIKVIHEEFTSLLICNDGVTVKATVVLDATGFSRSLVQYDKPYNPWVPSCFWNLSQGRRTPPFDLDKMVFMLRETLNNSTQTEIEGIVGIPTFLYAMPFSSDRIF